MDWVSDEPAKRLWEAKFSLFGLLFFHFFSFQGGSVIPSTPGIRNPSGPFSLGYVVSYTVNDGDSGGCWFFLLAFFFFSFLNDTYQWGINRRLEAFANRAGQARG